MTPLWHACDYYNTPIKVEDQTAFGLQKLRFEYKSGISFTNIQLSFTYIASHFTKWLLTLQVSLYSAFNILVV
ncbi:Hypothetical protein CKL_0075 [Clostridium kluyveri DSM 555]|uniref:Uncharacterized protein n=1 Tax=Clostridium kluyveri (strain ATCC 8527 / DSM 555 / NBRC 12016 / NCIMB 10680 / K1) TaxID=431943 RepID=A5N4C1_CLOK5|nr:Hypothetical protein CKL_0075 [Clostridium kluyveri DSM 555]